MKPIRICEENRAVDLFQQGFDNGGATAHTYTEYGEILYLAERAENSLASLPASKNGNNYHDHAKTPETIWSIQ